MQQFLKTLGPGILFASTAIGVSHLVQSTRAGAEYGFGLIGIVLLANVFKYPFFEYGSRYANVTRQSLIHGYLGIGKWMFAVYIGATLLTMFFVSAAVGAVTSGFMVNLFGLSDIPAAAGTLTPILFALCAIILMVGNYRGLDRLIKIIGSVLVIATVAAFVMVLRDGPQHLQPSFVLPSFFESPDTLPFVIALIGWMPTAVDLSAWNSLWTLERINDSGYRPSLRQTLTDFNIGYGISTVLALVFLALGAYLMYGSGNPTPDSAVAFADELLQLYAGLFGQWSYVLIATAAFSIMFGTCIAVFDGYARAAVCCGQLIRGDRATAKSDQRLYRITVAVTALGAYLVVRLLGAQIKSLVDFAMILSFMVAPIIAAANFYLVAGKGSHPAGRPKKWLQLLSWMGLLFLSAFAIAYLWL